ncbi:unnamed protein product [Cunninghamella blakesleeana]
MLPLLLTLSFFTFLKNTLSHQLINNNNGSSLLSNHQLWLPTCNLPTNLRKPRIAVFSHDEANTANYFHHPEQGALDAATIVDVQIEWNRHLVTNGLKMSDDIKSAVDQNVDGIILTIPDDTVFDAAKYALSQNIPMIVFNTGKEYATQLGLTRVLMDDKKGGELLGQQLYDKGFRSPLIFQTSHPEDVASKERLLGIQNTMKTITTPIFIKLNNYTIDPATEIKQLFQKENHDSIISLSGSNSVDLISEIALSMLNHDPNINLGVGFFDLGGNNMTTLFHRHKNVFAISHLPYYEIALPVFYMYLNIITGKEVYSNNTIYTGPNLVTNDTLMEVLENEQTTMIPLSDRTDHIGVIVPNIAGDTYNSAMMHGVFDLARHLNWTVLNSEQASIGTEVHLKDDISSLANKGINGIILKSSNELIDRYNKENKITTVQIGTFFEELNSNGPQVAIDFTGLIEGLVTTMKKDNIKSPACFSEQTNLYISNICLEFYQAFMKQKSLFTTTLTEEEDNHHPYPEMRHVVHYINISAIDAMDSQFHTILSNLKHDHYEPDAFITFSDHIFDIINSRILKGYLKNDTVVYTSSDLYDQIQAFIGGRIKHSWYLNLFSVGFLSLLYILLYNTISFQPWMKTKIATSTVNEICSPGTYIKQLAPDYFCMDNNQHTKLSVQCLPCEENTYNDQYNQHACLSCDYGTYALPGSSSCTPCARGDPYSQCQTFEADQSINQRHILLTILIPVTVICFILLFALFIWKVRKSLLRKHRLQDETWLLTFNELINEKNKHRLYHLEEDSTTLHSYDNTSHHSINNTNDHDDDHDQYNNHHNHNHNNNSDEENYHHGHYIKPNLNRNNMTTISLPSKFNHHHNYSNDSSSSTIDNSNNYTHVHDSNTIHITINDTDLDGYDAKSKNNNDSNSLKLPLNSTVCPKSQNKYFETMIHKEKNDLIYTKCYRGNLPVFVKHIGAKRIRIDEEVRTEAALMKETRHQNLVEFVGIILEPDVMYIVEEYCAKGSLADVLADPDIDLTWIFRFSLINDLIQGMSFLHRSKFAVHGCLTSNACFISSKWELKISDYGLNKIRRSQNDSTLVNSVRSQYLELKKDGHVSSRFNVIKHNKNLLWIAPESILYNTLGIYITNTSKNADIYSAGIIMNEIITRELPYQSSLDEGLTVEDIFNKIYFDNLCPDLSKKSDYAEKFNPIIMDCLQRNELARPNFTTIGNRIKRIDPSLFHSDNVVDNMAILLEKYANNMEKVVRKRTEHLVVRTKELELERARTQNLLKDLSAAKEVAEAAAASKQNFLANMSHEIRTPMNAVIGMSRMLMESNLPPDLYECAETIESSGNHLVALIDDILDYSKIESGRLALERSQLDLTFVLESAIKLLSSNYLGKGLALLYCVDPDLPIHVYGDLVRLRQIILNLLSNAFKFTEKGSVTINVTLENSKNATNLEIEDELDDYQPQWETSTPNIIDSEHNSLEMMTFLFSVCDTGIGIPKSKQKKLFKSFSQVDTSTTRNYGGTGLGLAISKQLCKMMGGDMWVESEEGEGSTFYFRVKLSIQLDSPTYGEQFKLNDLAKYNTQPLVISGEKVVQQSWIKTLNHFGIINVKVLSFSEAIEFFKSIFQQKTNKEQLPTTLIIDADFDPYDKTLPLLQNKSNTNETTNNDLQQQQNTAKTGIMTSHFILKSLQQMFDISSIPKLCINDVRLRNTTSFTESNSPYPFRHSPITPDANLNIMTPLEEINNPFDIQNLSKPFKNSKLINCLHVLSQSTLSTSSSTSSLPHISNSHPPISEQLLHPGWNTVLSNDTNNKNKFQLRLNNKKMNKTTTAINSTTTSRSATPISTPLSSRQCDYNYSEILGSIRALLVDDNPINRKVLSKMLSRIGLTCDIAHNGREAYEKWIESQKKDQPIELIFMDVFMPEMNGLEATTKIRQETNTTSTFPYIIAMTACVMNGDKEKCFDAGMNGYVSKPIRKEELEAAIHTFTQLIKPNNSDGYF